MQINKSVITGGTFFSTQLSDVCFQRLVNQVATGAFHDSGELSDGGTCHPGTRVGVLEELKEWALACPYPFPIKWLHGPAGAGKSAITRTIAEFLSLQNLLIASFFFFRADNRRNTVQHFFATITYQLCRSIPAARPYILAAIEEDPLVFSRSLSSQARSLIINPLIGVHADGQIPSDHPRIIIVDGLDECDGAERQCELLKVMNGILHQLPFPVALLVVSRPEFYIRDSFSLGALNKVSSRLLLDNNFELDEDIRRYFLAKFRDILDHHPLRSCIISSESDPWPGDKNVTLLVHKASGQFIFASTSILFINSPRHRPPDRLQIIIGLTSAGDLKPFEQLDILYTTIFNTIKDFPNVRRILGVRLAKYTWSNHHTTEYLEWLLGLKPTGEVQRLLIDLGSLLTFEDYGEGYISIKVFHASLADFLFDKSRSGKFYVDPGMIYGELAIRSIPLMTEKGRQATALRQELATNMSDWFRNANSSPDLKRSIKACDMSSLARFTAEEPILPTPVVGLRDLCPMFLSAIKASGFSDAPGLYSQKYAEYEVHLPNAVGIYLNGDRLTCLLLCLQAGATESFEVTKRTKGWKFLNSLVLRGETDHAGLGLLRCVQQFEAVSCPRIASTMYSYNQETYPIHNCHARTALCHIQSLLDERQCIDELYAEAATHLFTHAIEPVAQRYLLPTTSEVHAKVLCIGSSISKSAIQTNLAYILSMNLLSLEKYGNGNLPSSVVIYLCKYRKISRSRSRRFGMATSSVTSKQPGLRPGSSIVHPSSPEGQSVTVLHPCLATCLLDVEGGVGRSPAPSPQTSVLQVTRDAPLSLKMTPVPNPSSTKLVFVSRPANCDKISPLPGSSAHPPATG